VKFRRLLPLVLVPIILGAGAWQGWRWWQWLISPLSDAPGEVVQVEVAPGTPAQQIGHDLEAAGLIRSADAWSLWVRWKSWTTKTGGFQAGLYALDPAQSTPSIAEKIWNGDVIQQQFTIPEGWSRQQMAEYFEREGYFSAAEFLAASAKVPSDRYPWLPKTAPNLEGFLYPDTYQAATGTLTPEGVVTQMLDRFEQVALPVYTNTRQPWLSLLEWVTLASIVEKEAVVAQERELIAGVFTQRLKRGMKLESDPTVEFALGIRQTVEKPLTFAQVETPSPYNTYANPGLPPAPIASPGLPCLKATLNPAQTDYLFFMARYDGTHIFSRTLADHQAAIAEVERELEQTGKL